MSPLSNPAYELWSAAISVSASTPSDKGGRAVRLWPDGGFPQLRGGDAVHVRAVDAAIEALHPAGRLGTPGDVANTVFWLASADAAFVTGQEVVVDGGRLAKLPLPAL